MIRVLRRQLCNGAVEGVAGPCSEPARQNQPKEVAIMLTRKTLPKLTLALACSAAILWLGAGCGIIGPDYQCGTESLKQANKTREVALKYESLFKRQPNFPQAREGFLRDESTGHRTETWGIVVIVDGEKVDQDTLPPEDRIPDELEGVPVQIIPWQIAEKGDISQGGFPFTGDPHFLLAIETKSKNIDLFDDSPFSNVARTSGVKDGNGMMEIELFVTEKVDPLTLPPEDRIPDCLEDVPVKIRVDPNG